MLEKVQGKCEICGQEFKSAPELNQHLNIEHFRAFDLNCDRCETKWASISALVKHIAEVHKVIVTVCEQCGKTFKNAYTKVAHMR